MQEPVNSTILTKIFSHELSVSIDRRANATLFLSTESTGFLIKNRPDFARFSLGVSSIPVDLKMNSSSINNL